MYGLGGLFIFITTLVAILKKEKGFSVEDDYVKLNIVQTYTLMRRILNLPSIQILIMALLTMKVNIIKFNF